MYIACAIFCSVSRRRAFSGLLRYFNFLKSVNSDCVCLQNGAQSPCLHFSRTLFDICQVAEFTGWQFSFTVTRRRQNHIPFFVSHINRWLSSEPKAISVFIHSSYACLHPETTMPRVQLCGCRIILGQLEWPKISRSFTSSCTVSSVFWRHHFMSQSGRQRDICCLVIFCQQQSAVDNARLSVLSLTLTEILLSSRPRHQFIPNHVNRTSKYGLHEVTNCQFAFYSHQHQHKKSRC